MTADISAFLDACVLLPMPLADTLLRFAEHPRFYLPKWSDRVMAEVTRNLIHQWGVTPEKALRREAELRKHFPEAWVGGYELLIDSMTNHVKDRHVLAAAVRCGAQVIVTYNSKDFPQSALESWSIERQGPSTFLQNLYDADPALAMQKLNAQASAIGLSLPELAVRLRRNVPRFIDHLCQQQDIRIG